MFVLLADPAMAHANPGLYRTVQVGGLLAGSGALVGLLFVFVAAGHPERLGELAHRAERFLPTRLARAFGHAVERFAGGFAVMRQPGPLIEALVWSLPLWLSIASGIWCVTRAFHIEMSFLGSFLVMTLLAVGVAVPTPGAVGGFHYAYRLGVTRLFRGGQRTRLGAAIVLHAVSFVPVTLVGLLFMVQTGLA